MIQQFDCYCGTFKQRKPVGFQVTEVITDLLSLSRWQSRGSRNNELVFLDTRLTWTSIPSNLPEGQWGPVAIVPVHSWLPKSSARMQLLTAYLTRHPYNKCFNNVCFGVSVWSGRSYLSVLPVVCSADVCVRGVCTKCLGTWEGSPVGLANENTVFSFKTPNAFCMVPH